MRFAVGLIGFGFTENYLPTDTKAEESSKLGGLDCPDAAGVFGNSDYLRFF